MISSISFTGKNNDDNKVRVSEVGVVTGATVGGAKYGAGAFKRFNLNRDVVGLSRRATQNITQVANAGKQVNGLWNKMFANAKYFKESIVKYAKSTATGKFATKVVNSKAFGKASAVFGALGAGFVFISGLGEMSNTISKLANND